MRSSNVSIAIAACVLALSAGAAFANDLHPFVPFGAGNPLAVSAAPGQTGSNVLSSCGSTTALGYNSIGSQLGGKTNSGANSPFNPNAPAKHYAGNTGNPATNPNAVSQYDNACAQASLHAGFVPP
jgi:hypothetical protein